QRGRESPPLSPVGTAGGQCRGQSSAHDQLHAANRCSVRHSDARLALSYRSAVSRYHVTFGMSGISRPSSTPISALIAASSLLLISAMRPLCFSRFAARLTISEGSV